MKAPLILLALMSVAHAEPEPERAVSVTFSPVHLVLPMAEVEIEGRVAPHLGVAAIGGIGRITSNNITATAYEAGVQGNYYFLRDFAGLHAGVEVMYLSLGDVDVDSSVTADGFTAGPYVGYKGVFSFGLTLTAQLGVDFVVAHAKSSTTQQMASEKTVLPLLNLNAGWSF